MKILIATPLLPTQSGGPGQYGYQLSKALKARGCEVITIDFQRVRNFPSGVRHFLLCAILLKRMRGVDVIISLDTVSMALPAVLVARICGVKSIVRVGGDFVWEHFVERTKQKVKLSEFYTTRCSLSFKESMLIWLQRYIVFRFTDAIVFSTAWQKDIWLIPYNLPSSRVCVIENAYAPMKQQRVVHDTSKHIVWIGRDLVLKNVDILESAITEVQKKYPEVEFKKYSNISHREVVSILEYCRVLVIPSISEVSPNIVFEAFTHSVPVVLTDDCGLHEILRGKVIWIDATSSIDIEKKIGLLMEESIYTEAVTKIQQSAYSRTYTDVANDFLKLLHE